MSECTYPEWQHGLRADVDSALGTFKFEPFHGSDQGFRGGQITGSLLEGFQNHDGSVHAVRVKEIGGGSAIASLGFGNEEVVDRIVRCGVVIEDTRSGADSIAVEDRHGEVINEGGTKFHGIGHALISSSLNQGNEARASPGNDVGFGAGSSDLFHIGG